MTAAAHIIPTVRAPVTAKIGFMVETPEIPKSNAAASRAGGKRAEIGP
jgi:hypothetical protein